MATRLSNVQVPAPTTVPEVPVISKEDSRAITLGESRVTVIQELPAPLEVKQAIEIAEEPQETLPPSQEEVSEAPANETADEAIPPSEPADNPVVEPVIETQQEAPAPVKKVGKKKA